MRILLIAYDFPPVPSPQSLRWAYLVREMALAGHEVHVLAPDIPGYGAGGLPEIPENVRMHRVWPGPLMGLLAWRQRRATARSMSTVGSEASRGDAAGDGADGPHAQLSRARLRLAIKAELQKQTAVHRFIDRTRRKIWGVGLNWKGQLVECVKSAASLVMFPDVRAEWMPWARRELHRLLEQVRPDVVITSHEPANSIELGLYAKKNGFRWIADLGDPVLAPYTPRRWRKRAFALERMLCEKADMVTVTSEHARQILAERHSLPAERCTVVTQGFDHRFSSEAVQDEVPKFDAERLELLYTGSFYAFRRSGELIRAVLATPGVRLSIATVVAPNEVAEAAVSHPERVRMLGFVAHRQVLALQRRCDVLVNLANDDPVQVPGKLYEYLGTDVPILHVGGCGTDASTRLISITGAGWCEPASCEAISDRLRQLLEIKRSHGKLQRKVSTYDVGQHAWQSLAARVAGLIPAQGSAS